MADDALPVEEGLVERFALGLSALWPESRDPGARLGVAVSGGPDSLALLLLAAAALPGRVEAATVDHGLRAESGDEAAMVEAVCARLGVPHTILPVVVARGADGGNVQAGAREARYSALGEWLARRGLAALTTAHHADDQAETLLMRLNRASGVAGLAGVRGRATAPGGGALVLRPLLGWRRGELAAVVRDSGLAAVDDPSNRNPAYDRARLRARLAEADWLDIAAIAESAGHLADADAALDWAAAREWAEGVERDGPGLVYRPRAPRAIALRVLARIVAELDGEAPRGSALARLFDTLLARQPASIGALVARPMPGGWSFAKAPARRPLPPRSPQNP